MYKILGTDNKEYGPAPADQIRQWISERRLNAQSLVQAEGTTGWKPLSLVPEFSATLAGVAPPSAGQIPQAMSRAGGGANGLAVGSLICGCVGLLGSGMFCCCLPLTFVIAPVPLAGIVLGIVALGQLKKRPEQEGRGMAIAGIILSSAAFVISVGLTILSFAGVVVSEFFK